jgi:hypothetical protein
MSIDKDKGVIGYYEKRDEKAQTWFIECAWIKNIVYSIMMKNWILLL